MRFAGYGAFKVHRELDFVTSSTWLNATDTTPSPPTIKLILNHLHQPRIRLSKGIPGQGSQVRW